MSDLSDRVHRALARAAPAPVPEPGQIAELVRSADPLRPVDGIDRAVAAVGDQLRGLGPLQPLLDQPGTTDVLVNGPGPVWVERDGHLHRTDVHLSSEQVHLLVERIVAPLGRRADPVHALVDGRLPDGSRVHIAVPPLAVDGPCITIRRFGARAIPLEALAPPAVAALLRTCVVRRANVLVSGATGSGKTTLLNALAAGITDHERVITVEDAAELRLAAPHVVRLESRPAGVDGAPEVTIRELVRNALRMRPDRVIVGEVRGAEAYDLLTALSTGHDGSLSTIHANGAADALDRLHALVLLAGTGLPSDAVQRQLATALDLVVHLARDARGRRRVVEVAEVVPAERPPLVRARTLLGPDGTVRRPARARAGGPDGGEAR